LGLKQKQSIHEFLQSQEDILIIFVSYTKY